MIKKDGFAFKFDESKCAACGGKCCTGESGYIFVSVAEIEKIASFLGLEFEDFCLKYIKKVGYRFSLIEKLEFENLDSEILDSAKLDSEVLDSENPNSETPDSQNLDSQKSQNFQNLNYACIFFDKGKCAIYAARPKQCVDFPFWSAHKNLDSENLAKLQKECMGVELD